MYSTFFKRRLTPHLYHLDDVNLTQYYIQVNSRGKLRIFYANIPYQSDLQFTPEEFFPVDLQYCKKGLIMIAPFVSKPIPNSPPDHPTTLQEAYQSLPLALICGSITFPADNGEKLLGTISSSNNTLYSASDASVKDGRAPRAWIISSGNINDISNCNMHITGSRPVDGLPPFISSSRAELTGITAIAIITRIFLEFHSYTACIHTYCDNQGVTKKCQLHRSKNFGVIVTRIPTYF